GGDPDHPTPCNLHGVWDSGLIVHRGSDDPGYLKALDEVIRSNTLDARPIGGSAEWAMESHAFAKAALVPPKGAIDETYYRRRLPVVDERLALAGIRLAALINRSLTTPPPSREAWSASLSPGAEARSADAGGERKNRSPAGVGWAPARRGARAAGTPRPAAARAGAASA